MESLKLKNYTLYVVTEAKCVSVKSKSHGTRVLKPGTSFFYRKDGEMVLEIDEKEEIPMQIDNIEDGCLKGIKELF